MIANRLLQMKLVHYRVHTSA